MDLIYLPSNCEQITSYPTLRTFIFSESLNKEATWSVANTLTRNLKHVQVTRENATARFDTSLALYIVHEGDPYNFYQCSTVSITVDKIDRVIEVIISSRLWLVKANSIRDKLRKEYNNILKHSRYV